LKQKETVLENQIKMVKEKFANIFVTLKKNHPLVLSAAALSYKTVSH